MNRTKYVKVPISPSEDDELNAISEKLRISKGAYLRMMGLGKMEGRGVILADSPLPDHPVLGNLGDHSAEHS